LAQAELSLAQSELAVAQAQVALFRALGWSRGRIATLTPADRPATGSEK
jgi:hypothetical protein